MSCGVQDALCNVPSCRRRKAPVPPPGYADEWWWSWGRARCAGYRQEAIGWIPDVSLASPVWENAMDQLL